jgi:hypothetical protein
MIRNPVASSPSLAERKVTPAEDSEWDLVDFTKKVFGTHQTSAESISGLDVSAKVDEAKARWRTEPQTITAIGRDPAPNVHNPGSETPDISVPVTREAAASAATPFRAGKHGRQLQSATEMSNKILNALRRLNGVPDDGFVVTVYGSNPWNAMLTITPEAGGVKHDEMGHALMLRFKFNAR